MSLSAVKTKGATIPAPSLLKSLNNWWIMRIALRPWAVKDAVFACYVRNDPKLMRWFRQDAPIELDAQKQFIQKDIEGSGYNGNVILANDKPVGLCGVKWNGEFT